MQCSESSFQGPSRPPKFRWYPDHISLPASSCPATHQMTHKYQSLWSHSAYSESVSWVAWPIGEASRAEPKFCLWFLWREQEWIARLRAKFWRGPSYHAKRCLQGYQHVILSSIVCLRAVLWHKTVLPPSRGSIRFIIAEKHWQCHISRKPEV